MKPVLSWQVTGYWSAACVFVGLARECPGAFPPIFVVIAAGALPVPLIVVHKDYALTASILHSFKSIWQRCNRLRPRHLKSLRKQFT